jgi:predicted esterase
MQMRDCPNADMLPAALQSARRIVLHTFRGAIWLGAFGAAAANAANDGATKNVTFDTYSALSSSAEMARRMLTPLTYRRIEPHLANARQQPIDLSGEKFLVHVPDGAPPAHGYGLLVFIPPWPQASLPKEWFGVLDRHALIFVTAANSGNEAGMLDRRVPLALLGFENVRSRYPIDANRVYVGGMSGGSRVALRVALAYPDVFRGALLNAGSDPIGGDEVSLPPVDLLHRFQESTRLIFLTGARDEINMHNDLLSQTSLRSWCMFDFDSVTIPRRGHEIADAAGLAQALKKLEQPSTVEAGKLAQCRTMLDEDLASKVAEAQTAIRDGDHDRAVAAIASIDVRYGGMAEQAIATLEDQARHSGTKPRPAPAAASPGP